MDHRIIQIQTTEVAVSYNWPVILLVAVGAIGVVALAVVVFTKLRR